ncbi:MAG: hypothetical protein HAW65_00735 [Alphaproteobacteria bacterium]|nr:hypothetical protein [Alphaproteobacteria bacterium]MBE8219821.1 hypothetical protein [Alphaproteobacteria bacterium]
MIKSGQILQETLFAHLASNEPLAAHFAPMMDKARAMPFFSFDALQSTMRDKVLNLVAHEIEFSVWSPVQSPKDAAVLTADVLAQFETLPTTQAITIIRFEAETITAAVDNAARAWRTQITFTALTQ